MINEERAANFFLPYVVTIFRLHKTKSIEFFGSGFLIKDLDEYYLASAAHVLDHLYDDEPLFMSLPNGLMSIDGLICTTAAKEKITRTDDQLDIGMVALHESNFHKLSGVVALALENFDEGGEIHGAHGYVVAGYPTSKNKDAVDPLTKSINPSAYIGICWEAQDDVYAQLKHTRDFSLALNFNIKKVYSLDGEKRAAPALNGLSGSPVWGFTKNGVAKVAGMLVEYHHGTKKCIIATRSRCIVSQVKILRCNRREIGDITE